MEITEMITIPKKEYEELLEDQKMLDALKGAGVDNWEGYDDALDTLEDVAKHFREDSL
jgi:hypothetical protein